MKAKQFLLLLVVIIFIHNTAAKIVPTDPPTPPIFNPKDQGTGPFNPIPNQISNKRATAKEVPKNSSENPSPIIICWPWPICWNI